MRGRRLLPAAALLTLTASSGWIVSAAQNVAPPAAASPAAATGDPDPVTIRINAVVTDAKGRPVGDLHAADFALEDNGVAQTLTAVELRAMAAAPSPPAPAPAPVQDDDDELRAAREPGTRLFAIFLDEFHTSPGQASASVRDAVQRFLDEDVRPRDLLFVMKPLGSVRAIRFTRDLEAARAAVASFEGRKGDYEPRTDFEREFFGRAPGAVEFARSQIVTTALRELTLRIGELRPTRAALVLAAEGLSRASGETRRLPGWVSLARAASHFNLPIYTLDPRQPEPESAPAPPSTGTPTAAAAAAGNPRPRPATMESLSSETGGESAAGPASLAATLRQLSRDLDSYYVLTYRPSQPTDGRFHPIVLTSRRQTVTVRAPAGYWSPLASEWRTWLNRPTTPAITLPTRALHKSRLIDVWYGFEPQTDGSLRMLLTWSPNDAIPVTARTPRPSAVALKASSQGGDRLFDQGVRAVPVPADVDGASTRAEFSVPPGRLQLDFSIEAPDGGVLDTGAQDIDVPAFRGSGPVLLQPQFVRARTRREIERLAERDDLSPSPTRTFRRTERLLLRVPVYTAGGPPATVIAMIVNSRGQKIRDVQALSPSPSGTAQFDMPVSYLPPGDYGLEIMVESPAGRARQLVHFVLTG